MGVIAAIIGAESQPETTINWTNPFMGSTRIAYTLPHNRAGTGVYLVRRMGSRFTKSS